jgi:class 3 adenylate cyclase
MAARLEGLSTGNDVVISAAVYNDPEVRKLLNSSELQAVPFVMELKGFDEERFDLWRVVRKGASLSAASV